MSNVIRLSNHPLDHVDAPDIVNTVIEERPVYYQERTGFIQQDSNRKAIHVKGSNEPPISIFKKGYNISGAQYSDMYTQMVNICKASDVDCTGVSVDSSVSPNGARGTIKITLPAHTVETARGDETQLQLLGYNSVDGSWPMVIRMGAVRMACINGQIMIDDFAVYKAKHTMSLDLGHARRKMAALLNSYTEEVERWRGWSTDSISDRFALITFAKAAKCKVNVESMSNMSLLEILDHPSLIKNKAFRYLWNQYTQHEQKSLGSTKWAVYNALTHWTTHAPVGKKTDKNSVLKIKETQQIAASAAIKQYLVAA
jgi:hypothetical protein